MGLTVLDAGLCSLLVDGGRPRTRHVGVPLGGAADRTAWQLGNALLGNPVDAAALEVTMSGPTLRAESPTACAIFGAPFLAAIANKRRVEPGSTFTLEAGDVLKISGTPCGVRAYLCVKGGFATPPILESRSSLEPVQVGDVLPCETSRVTGRALPFCEFRNPSPQAPSVTLRVVPGPQYDWFFQADEWFDGVFEVLPASNRMGIRLRGGRLERRPGELVSEAVAPGAIQITNEGQPIVLGVDGQTIGGYPKIAHVIAADRDELAQLRPGNTVVFQRVDDATATRALQDRTARLQEWLLRLQVAAI